MRRLSRLHWVVGACVLVALGCVGAMARTAIGAHVGVGSYHNITELRYPGRVLVQAGPHGVVLRSSGSTLTIDKKGNITILAAKDVTIKARGDLHLSGDHVNIDEMYPAEAEGTDTDGG